ncbi:MAG: hypothetical protein BZ151_02065 [Desulfobacca sp. 4484_104]|nr:MAG: hypothetical protein BZ151_02065 [Desulfobacca sp. 4484_104]RLA90270.1 MAG: hypothetical protein DRG58_02600 [Deltaproteobacteria bacterium]
MFKNILVCCDGGTETEPSLQLAVSLAGLSTGRVRGLLVKRLIGPDMVAWPTGLEMGAEAPPLLDSALVAEIEAEQEQTAKRVAVLFSRLVSETTGLEVVRGDVVEQMVRAARTADLLVMGRGIRAPESARWRLSDTTRRVLKKSWAPVLLPAAEAASLLDGPYLLAYDGSPAANYGLRQVARLAALTGAALTILSVGNPETNAGRLQEAQTYLQPYGLKVSLEDRDGKPETVILELNRQQQFGLIALGAQGHHRLKDIFLGTTTENILHDLPLAFLICNH